MGGESSDGHRLASNSRFLTLDGVPFFPVMAEMHFSRYPQQYWEEEILKMKAGGVRVVATYVFWIHHEEVLGQFDWSGQRNLRRFVQLCQKHGLLAWVRIGPWAHGECRNGGFPDWLLKSGPVRQNDPQYLGRVKRLYDQIGRQLQGLYWKDGGPVIGVQLENEYGQRGPKKGAEHYLELKRLAIESGIQAPFYTLTGWGNPDLPGKEILPVYGGYPDGFWYQTVEQLPPSDMYCFSNERSDENIAAELMTRKPGDPPGRAEFPFLTAEMGGGMQVAYHRRPVIGPDDIASMLLTRVGSGVVLYGYYMFHGGANPEGKLSTLQESRATGYPNDLPVVSYDFQAPLSQYGQVRPAFRLIRTMHLFLRDFGDEIAPMTTHLPSLRPKHAEDLKTVRAAARMKNGRGFVFFNNYQRNYPLPAHYAVQLELKTPSETINVPRRPFDLPEGAYFMWPVNLNVSGAVLKFATAQPVCKLEREDAYFFFAWPGVEVEFAWDARTVREVRAPRANVSRADGRVYVSGIQPGTDVAAVVESLSGRKVRIIVLTREQAGNLSKESVGGREFVFLSGADMFLDGNRLHLRSRNNELNVSAYPPLSIVVEAGIAVQARGRNGVFTRYTASVPRKTIKLACEKIGDAAKAVPEKTAKGMAVMPEDRDFERAATWRIRVPDDALTGLSDLFLAIPYAGSVARLYRDGKLLDDDFYNGNVWEIGWKRFAAAAQGKELVLKVMPLRKDTPIYIEHGHWPEFPPSSEISAVKEVTAIPEYEVTMRIGNAP